MRGELTDVPLLGVLELIHTTEQTGTLHVRTRPPYSADFSEGHLVGGGVLDWRGEEALFTCPLLSTEGDFEFRPSDLGALPTRPYEQVLGEWARTSDEWEAACRVIGSPSHAHWSAQPPFEVPGGRSARAAASHTGAGLLDTVRELSAAAVRGEALPQPRYAWFALRLRPAALNLPPQPGVVPGEKQALGRLADAGYPVPTLRRALLRAIEGGARFSGCGWVLRDLLWEERYDPPGPALLASDP